MSKFTPSQWPTTLSGEWPLIEMRPDARRPHVLKHLYDRKERWWSILDQFTRKMTSLFIKRARAAGCTIWFPPSEVDEHHPGRIDEWMASWPADLLDELSESYDRYYREYTISVLQAYEAGRLVNSWWDHADRDDTSTPKGLILLDHHNVIVILRWNRGKNFRWVTTYRDFSFEVKQGHSPRDQVVHNYDEASLY
jgi:hypothetical protein